MAKRKTAVAAPDGGEPDPVADIRKDGDAIVVEHTSGKIDRHEPPEAGQVSYDAIELLVKGLSELTGATPEAALSFAQAFLPGYAEAFRAKRDAKDDEALAAARAKLADAKTEIALRGGNHGVEIHQGQLERVYSLLESASA